MALASGADHSRFLEVRLTVDGKTLEAPLTIKMDPRVESTRADLENLFSLESKLAAMVSSSAEASLEAHSIQGTD